MLNTDDFVKRLEHLMDFYGYNASGFADKIGVQRSSISHLLSGRNKPSLDFVMKILDLFPDVNLYWILNQSEQFLKSDLELTKKIATPTPTLKEAILEQNLFSENPVEPVQKLKTEEVITTQTDFQVQENLNKTNSNIFKIVIFYKDGSFKDFDSRSYNNTS
jgi:transcriptional regulator with XRE-family HTH domain